MKQDTAFGQECTALGPLARSERLVGADFVQRSIDMQLIMVRNVRVEKINNYILNIITKSFLNKSKPVRLKS